MQEPTTAGAAISASINASLMGGLIVFFGPVIGVWLAVVLSSLVGGLWSIGRVQTESKFTAALLLGRIVLTAVVLTGGLSIVVTQKLGVSQSYALPVVAFAIGALGDKFEALKDAVVDRIKSFINGGSV